MKKSTRTAVLVALVVSLGSLGLAYAALSQSLNLNATVQVLSSSLDVVFNGVEDQTTGNILTTSHAFNGAVVSSEGEISGTNISNYSVQLNNPGSYVETEIEAENNSEFFDVRLSRIEITNLGTSSLVWNEDAMQMTEEVASQSQEENISSKVLTEQAKEALISGILSNVKITVYTWTPPVSRDSWATDSASRSANGIATFQFTSQMMSGNNLSVNILEQNQNVRPLTKLTGKEYYILKIEYLFAADTVIPPEYSFVQSGMDISFVYAQVANTANSNANAGN